MSIDNVNLFDLASKRLQWASHRQSTIAENIANSDVSGFRTKEVESFDSYVLRAQGAAAPLAPRIIETERTWSAAPSGNNVVIEEQLLEASSANGQYRMATNLYRKAYELMANVVTGR